ncbi:hypothetical protein HGRIS_014009 [Hohenbuehelia grisea]|uniref:Uncharacterized protein n=1 Tax=Hohenbuehelia grisea TaxID=104357 RepID=A0ABR3JSC3_9AGAR
MPDLIIIQRSTRRPGLIPRFMQLTGTHPRWWLREAGRADTKTAVRCGIKIEMQLQSSSSNVEIYRMVDTDSETAAAYNVKFSHRVASREQVCHTKPSALRLEQLARLTYHLVHRVLQLPLGLPETTFSG